MSESNVDKSNVEKVRILVTQDPSLQQRLQTKPDEKTFVEELIAIGAEKGLPFTATELAASAKAHFR